MKRFLKGLVLAVTLACVAQAQQMVIWVTDDHTHELESLLKRGWHITNVAITRNSGYITTVFVLESPTKETTK